MSKRSQRFTNGYNGQLMRNTEGKTPMYLHQCALANVKIAIKGKNE